MMRSCHLSFSSGGRAWQADWRYVIPRPFRVRPGRMAQLCSLCPVIPNSFFLQPHCPGEAVLSPLPISRADPREPWGSMISALSWEVMSDEAGPCNEDSTRIAVHAATAHVAPRISPHSLPCRIECGWTYASLAEGGSMARREASAPLSSP
jgi:hypothetical protein